MENSLRKIVSLIFAFYFFSNAWSQNLTGSDSLIANPYFELDNYAKETPENVSKSSEQLVQYLGKKASNDLEKTRLIFVWIATHINYDDKAFNTGKYPEQTAKNVLKKRTAVCAGYSSLFDELAKLMGLKEEKISGYAKGYGYSNGQRVTKTNHDWNAVKINGSWQLIDVTWGSSKSESTESGLKTSMKFDDYWFMTSPDEFIFSHLPVSNKWQLVRHKINLIEFNKLPFVHSLSFKMGFNAKEIFKSFTDGGLSRLVKTYDSPYPLKILEMPYNAPLIVGKEYIFKFQSNRIRHMVFVQNENWTLLKKEGDIFSGVIIPQTKTLQIGVAIAPKYRIDNILFAYDVVEKK